MECRQYLVFLIKYLYVNLDCLSVCLYPINVKTTESIWSKFFVGPRVTPGKVYGGSNFQKFASNKIRFLKMWRIHDFFLNTQNCFCFVLLTYLVIYLLIFVFVNIFVQRKNVIKANVQKTFLSTFKPPKNINMKLKTMSISSYTQQTDV